MFILSIIFIVVFIQRILLKNENNSIPCSIYNVRQRTSDVPLNNWRAIGGDDGYFGGGGGELVGAEADAVVVAVVAVVAVVDYMNAGCG